MRRGFFNNMAKKKEKEKVSMIATSKGEGPLWYKSYDIRWLKGLGEEHPKSERLVEKYENKYGVIK